MSARLAVSLAILAWCLAGCQSAVVTWDNGSSVNLATKSTRLQ